MRIFWRPSLRLTELDFAELASCRLGDELKLWTSPNLDWINVYRPGSVGGDGRVGRLEKRENQRVAMLLEEGLPVWLEVLECDGETLRVEVKYKTHEDVSEDAAAAALRLRAELLRPLRKHEPISIEVRSDEGFVFKLAQRYTLNVPNVDRYCAQPTLDIPLRGADGTPARGIPPAAQRKLILRAHYSGFDIHLLVVAIGDGQAYAGNRDRIWNEAAATVRAPNDTQTPPLIDR
jgi:hypothetical protein